MDYRRATLTLAQGEVLPVRGGVALPLQIDRRRPLVRWPPGSTRPGARAPVLLLVDSGADALVIDASTSTFACRTGTRRAASLDTQAGRRDVQACEVDEFRIGGRAVYGLQLVSMSWPDRNFTGGARAAACGGLRARPVSPAPGTVTFWLR